MKDLRRMVQHLADWLLIHGGQDAQADRLLCQTCEHLQDAMRSYTAFLERGPSIRSDMSPQDRKNGAQG